MNYIYDGLFYRLISPGCFLLVLGIFLLCLFFFGHKKHKKKQELICALVAIGIALSYMTFISYKIVNPDIVSCEGIFLNEYRDSRVAPPLPFTGGYVFDVVDKDTDSVFYLDTFARKKICPSGLVENEMYTVYFEEDTKIIVGISQSEADKSLNQS